MFHLAAIFSTIHIIIDQDSFKVESFICWLERGILGVIVVEMVFQSHHCMLVKVDGVFTLSTREWDLKFSPLLQVSQFLLKINIIGAFQL